jgi:hypothetical protein
MEPFARISTALAGGFAAKEPYGLLESAALLF